MSDPIDQIDVEALNEALAENEAKVLYDMYISTNSLKDFEYLDPREEVEKVVVSGKTVTVHYQNGTSLSYTGE
jgi:hypothetical protein